MKPRKAEDVVRAQVLEVGATVRVQKGFLHAGKHGRITDRGARPDGRTFWTVRLDIATSTGNPDREYYSEELTAI